MVIFPFAGLAIIVATLFVRRRAARLLQHGTLGEARVESIDVIPGKNKQQAGYRVSLREIGAAKGREFEFRTQNGNLVGFARERLESNQPVFVLYDPAKPKRMIFPESLHW